MSAASSIKQFILGTEWTEHVHARHCAARNWRSAVFVVVLCAFQALLAWRLLRTEFPPLSFPSFLVALIVIGFGGSFFLAYPCFRERFVSGLFVLRGLLGFGTFLAPGAAHEFLRPLRNSLFALWVIAFVLGLTLVLQSAREQS